MYPGRRPDNWDVKSDSNCNGIWGVDPKDGIPYEEKFCKGADSQGVVLLGDSAGAHFHIPPEWMTVTQMSTRLDRLSVSTFTQEKSLQSQRLTEHFPKWWFFTKSPQFNKKLGQKPTVGQSSHSYLRYNWE